ncbi:UPF0676 protein C1494.01 [Folsomia candida]|nr:UPF0676 protein C1494.01 [Folsomia candida]
MSQEIPHWIPVVDLSPIRGEYGDITKEAYAKVVTQLGDAMSGIGFCYLVNHGIETAKVDHVYDVSRKFFAKPIQYKRKYLKVNPPENFHGYTEPGAELLNEAEKNSTELREVWDMWGWWGPNKSWEEACPDPVESPGFTEAFEALRPEMDNVSKKLFKLLALYLQLDDEDFFIKRHRNLGDLSIPCQTQMRSMFYDVVSPDAKLPPGAIRCGEHSDWGSITLLFQDSVGGLEVQNVLGEWVQATPIPDSIILNSGQLMELWTGGRLHAALHRVKIPESADSSGKLFQQPRQSFIYFVNPDGPERVSPVLPIREGKEELATKPTLVAFDHYKARIVEATMLGY